MIEYIVAKSSHTRLCPGVPLWSFTSSSSDIEDAGICGLAEDGGAYGDGLTGT